jgi:hypothetical protein
VSTAPTKSCSLASTTPDKLFAGIIVPGDKLLPVLLKRRLRLVLDFHRFHDTFMRKLRNNKSAFLIGLGFIGHF